ncbi:MAG: ribosome biogenesis GTPase Der [Candidatus Omnitrophica bacterium]|nr:ribosome biogenesis GTPase Der [Candidatus Omnitrophota bacterium]
MRLQDALPAIAIVGRPNVGKSTLFNRLVGSRQTVTSPARGTTRDRIHGQAEWRGTRFALIDTGGFELGAGNGLAEAVQRQIRQALEEADAVLLVCDGQAGLVPADELILERVRLAGKPLVVAINKLDHRLAVPPDFFALGVEEPVPISALHGRGTGDLLDRLLGSLASAALPAPRPADAAEARQAGGAPRRDDARRPSATLAILGRQNVGKSSLLNALLREERVIVSETPGTTRDAVDSHLVVGGEPVVLVDTAGLRHRRKVRDPVDLFAMSRTIQALERCDAALVLLDATQGVTRDDRRLVAKVCEAGRGLVLLVNKWDLVKRASARALAAAVQKALPFAAFAPVLAISAKTGFQVSRSLTLALAVTRRMRRPMDEAECLARLRAAWAAHPPPRLRGRAIRLARARWVPGRPVRVELGLTPPGRLPGSYHHYLQKALYAPGDLAGVPLRLVVEAPARRARR